MTKRVSVRPTMSREVREALMDVARGNIERNAEWDEEASADTIYDEVYTLAFDALHDHGCADDVCRDIATELAMGYANP